MTFGVEQGSIMSRKGYGCSLEAHLIVSTGNGVWDGDLHSQFAFSGASSLSMSILLLP